jgi:hypothetical protein
VNDSASEAVMVKFCLYCRISLEKLTFAELRIIGLWEINIIKKMRQNNKFDDSIFKAGKVCFKMFTEKNLICMYQFMNWNV